MAIKPSRTARTWPAPLLHQTQPCGLTGGRGVRHVGLHEAAGGRLTALAGASVAGAFALLVHAVGLLFVVASVHVGRVAAPSVVGVIAAARPVAAPSAVGASGLAVRAAVPFAAGALALAVCAVLPGVGRVLAAVPSVVAWSTRRAVDGQVPGLSGHGSLEAAAWVPRHGGGP